MDTYLTDDVVHDNWDLDGLRRYTFGWLTTSADLNFTTEQLENTSAAQVKEMLNTLAENIMAEKAVRYGEETVKEIERYVLLKAVDTNWMNHIDAMDELRRGIGLRAYGQHNPVVAYRNESYDMFSSMTDTIREETAKAVLSAEIRQNTEIKREKVAVETGTGDDGTVSKTVRGKGVVGKNALCPCGSGKKYKRCCGKDID